MGQRTRGCGRPNQKNATEENGGEKALNGKKKNEGSGTNLDRSKGCRGARTGMTRRTPRAKEDTKEGQGSRREGEHRQNFQVE